MLERVRWTNVAAALAVAAILGLVVGWPLLEPKTPDVPPPAAVVDPPPPTAAPTARPHRPEPFERAARKRRPKVVAAQRMRRPHQVKTAPVQAPVTTPVPAVAPPSAPAVVAPAPPRDFGGIER